MPSGIAKSGARPRRHGRAVINEVLGPAAQTNPGRQGLCRADHKRRETRGFPDSAALLAPDWASSPRQNPAGWVGRWRQENYIMTMRGIGTRHSSGHVLETGSAACHGAGPDRHHHGRGERLQLLGPSEAASTTLHAAVSRRSRQPDNGQVEGGGTSPTSSRTANVAWCSKSYAPMVSASRARGNRGLPA